MVGGGSEERVGNRKGQLRVELLLSWQRRGTCKTCVRASRALQPHPTPPSPRIPSHTHPSDKHLSLTVQVGSLALLQRHIRRDRQGPRGRSRVPHLLHAALHGTHPAAIAGVIVDGAAQPAVTQPAVTQHEHKRVMCLSPRSSVCACAWTRSRWVRRVHCLLSPPELLWVPAQQDEAVRLVVRRDEVACCT